MHEVASSHHCLMILTRESGLFFVCRALRKCDPMNNGHVEVKIDGYSYKQHIVTAQVVNNYLVGIKKGVTAEVEQHRDYVKWLFLSNIVPFLKGNYWSGVSIATPITMVIQSAPSDQSHIECLQDQLADNSRTLVEGKMNAARQFNMMKVITFERFCFHYLNFFFFA